MPNGSCFVVLFAGVLCLFAVHSAEGQAGNCNLTGGYDINTLTKLPYWTVEVDSKFNCSSISQSVVHSCKMYLSFCHALPINKTDPAGFCRVVDEKAGLHRNASMCMVINKELDNQTANTFGTYQPRQDPFKALSVVDGKTGFESQAFDGNSFGSHCFTTQSFVQFRCDLGADWTQIHDGNATRYLLSAGFSNLETCLFFMVFAYRGACVAAPITTSSPAPTVAPTPANQGVVPGIPGFILIAVFLALVVAYLVIGSIINLALGKRSAADVFPNYAFWVGLPHLLLDGARFSFHLVTCFNFNKTASPLLSDQGKSKGQYETLPE